MKKIGIISYNIYGSFTNYGSALQSWALHKTINRLGREKYQSVLVDYCPEIHMDKDILNPVKSMWDQDEESIKACELTLPAIRENYFKFAKFYNGRFNKTKTCYTYKNFKEINANDGIDSFVCGSDTIFCTLEFHGFDHGYFANYSNMRGKSISYAASFGDAVFDNDTYPILNERLNNFKALGIREEKYIPYIKQHCDIPCSKTIDPTLLLTSEDYDTIAEERVIEEKYILLYARRYNQKMFDFADCIAKEKGYKIVDISLRAETLRNTHEPWYKAGVEEFLSLVKYAEFVITNSFHGLIFAVQYCRPFVVFSREQADSKIGELLDLFGLKKHIFIDENENYSRDINYNLVHNRIEKARIESISFLERSLEQII